MTKPQSLFAGLALVCLALIGFLTACQRGRNQCFRLEPPTTVDRQFMQNISTRPNDVLELDGRWRVPDGTMTVMIVSVTGPLVLIHNGPTDRKVVIGFERYPDNRPFKGEIRVTVKRPGAVSGTDTYRFTPILPP